VLLRRFSVKRDVQAGKGALHTRSVRGNRDGAERRAASNTPVSWTRGSQVVVVSWDEEKQGRMVDRVWFRPVHLVTTNQRGTP
jgi:hypothetical protein